jgi:hypothetical protein
MLLFAVITMVFAFPLYGDGALTHYNLFSEDNSVSANENKILNVAAASKKEVTNTSNKNAKNDLKIVVSKNSTDKNIESSNLDSKSNKTKYVFNGVKYTQSQYKEYLLSILSYKGKSSKALALKKSLKKFLLKKIEAKNLKEKKAKLTPEIPDSLEDISGKSGLSKLQVYMNRNYNHRTGGSSTAVGVQKTRYGDCWGLADWAARVLAYNDYDTRIVQGATSASSNHRWVQVKLNNKWVNFESSMITKKYGSKHYSYIVGRPTRIAKYL